MKFRDYYEVMGLAKGASADEIKRAYRRLARKYHPDVSKEADAEERFKELGEAYEVLKDPEKREAYDRLGENWKQGEDFRPPPDWGYEFHEAPQGHTQEHDFSDFFESLFGGMAGARRGSAGGGRAGFRPAGVDTSAEIELSLEEAFAGGTRTLTLGSVELDAQGHPQRRNRQLKVAIPAGVTDGQQIRLAGQGEAALGSKQRGDLYLTVKLAPHRYFRVQGRDIVLRLPVTPWEAALGESVRVPTLAGRVDLKLPKGSQSGRQLRLKGRGLPGQPPGDQIVELVIETPPAATEADEALYRKMSEQMKLNPRAALEK
jgi:curved DNA-binding protein